MSNEEVVLNYGDALFTIDFVRTTPFDRRKCIPYEQDFQVNPPLKTFDKIELRSGPYQALKQLGELREFRSFAGALFAVMFAVLAIMTGAMGVLATRPTDGVAQAIAQASTPPAIPVWWPTAALMMSFAAVVLAIFATFFVINKTRRF
jgi:hypothetical protein